jgi:hypothetical protein
VYPAFRRDDETQDQARRDKARVPETIGFQTEPEIAFEQNQIGPSGGVAPGCGADGCRLWQRHRTASRDRRSRLALRRGHWVPVAAAADDHPSCFGATGSINRSWQRPSVSGLPAEAWHAITWREGSADWHASRFAQQRVRPAHRGTKLSEPRAEEWLLIERPQNETEPTKYWFATLPECRS